jgi:hypothetical protein
MLTEDQRNLWVAYEAAESRAPRAEKVRALNAFLDALTMSPPTDWFPWARAIAEQVVDGGINMVIRRPLFERAVFPALLDGYQARLPGSARWLAGLSQQLQSSRECCERLHPDDTSELALLLAAIRHDPSDRRSRLRLIQKIADRLRYSLHEIPAGVLFGMDGASPEQCLELEAELEEFCQLTAAEQMEQNYVPLVAACRHHFRAYRDFILHKEKYESYAEYLAQHPEGIEG